MAAVPRVEVRLDAHPEDAADQAAVRCKGPQALHPEGAAGPLQQPQHHQAGHRPGHQAGQGCTQHPHAKAVDQHRVAADVDDVHHQAGQHADLAVALRPEQRRTGVVQTDEGVAQRREQEVSLSVAHHVGVNGAEDAPQDGVAAHYDHGGHHQAQAGQHKQDLCGGGLGVFGLPVADVLTGDHGTAGGKGAHHLDHQGVEAVYQAHAGHGGLAHRGHHQGVGQADGHAQGLLGDERQQQCHQRLPGEERVDWFLGG